MELRILEALVTIFDPRKWKLRIKQVGAGLAIVLWVWYRSVSSVEKIQENKKIKHAKQNKKAQDLYRKKLEEAANRPLIDE